MWGSSSAKQVGEFVQQLQRVRPTDVGEQAKYLDERETARLILEDRAVIGDVASDHPHDDRRGKTFVMIALSRSWSCKQCMERVEHAGRIAGD